jgi:hypothetical protein
MPRICLCDCPRARLGIESFEFSVFRNELTIPERFARCGALDLGILQFVFLILGALHVVAKVSTALTLLALCLAALSWVSLGAETHTGPHLHSQLRFVVALCVALILSETPLEAQTLTVLPLFIAPIGRRAGEEPGICNLENTSPMMIRWEFGTLMLVAFPQPADQLHIEVCDGWTLLAFQWFS